MSVLVKGIDMPKSCGECRFLSFPYNVPVCSATREIFTYSLYQEFAQALKKRLDNCPLVSVSEGQEEWLDGMNVLYGEDEEPRYCDRNICTENEYNGVSCDTCYIAQNYNLEDDDSPCLNCGVEW